MVSNIVSNTVIVGITGIVGIEVCINVVTDKIGVTFMFSVYIDLLS